MKKDFNEFYMLEPFYPKSRVKYIILIIFLILIIGIGILLILKSLKESETTSSIVEYKREAEEKENEVVPIEQETPILQEIPTLIPITTEEPTLPPQQTSMPELEEKKNKIPVVTESGRQNVKKIYSSTIEKKRVFLTFDDGPSSNITPLILDVLKENHVKATFFTLGSRVVKNPQIVKRAYEEGHYIANHGYSHVYKNIYESEENLLAEYNQTEEVIRNAIEVPEYSSHLFRFPGGSVGGKYNDVKKEYTQMLGEHDILYVDWNCLNEDAMGKYTKEQLVQFIKDTSNNKNSVVVLMHDSSDKILTYETLQEVIDYFRENGYTFYNFYDIIEYELK